MDCEIQATLRNAWFYWPSIPHDFVQIIHVGDSHWTCISNKFCKKVRNHVAELFDSMHTEPGSTTKEQICTFLHCCLQLMINVQRQKLGDSCGLYTITMALDICEGRDQFLSSYSEIQMRFHLEKCFESKCLTKFPEDIIQGARDRLKRRVYQTVDVNLFCVCRYPDVDITSYIGDLACNENCQWWYHSNCKGIPRSVFSKSEMKWMCGKYRPSYIGTAHWNLSQYIMTVIICMSAYRLSSVWQQVYHNIVWLLMVEYLGLYRRFTNSAKLIAHVKESLRCRLRFVRCQ